MVLDSAFCKYKFIRCTCLGRSLSSRIEVQCVTVSVHVWVGGDGLRGGGVGGSYQPGVSVPLKALFLVGVCCVFLHYMDSIISYL